MVFFGFRVFALFIRVLGRVFGPDLLRHRSQSPNTCQYELKMIPSSLTSFSGQDRSGLHGKQYIRPMRGFTFLPYIADSHNVNILETYKGGSRPEFRVDRPLKLRKS